MGIPILLLMINLIYYNFMCELQLLGVKVLIFEFLNFIFYNYSSIYIGFTYIRKKYIFW